MSIFDEKIISHNNVNELTETLNIIEDGGNRKIGLKTKGSGTCESLCDSITSPLSEFKYSNLATFFACFQLTIQQYLIRFNKIR